MDVDPKAKQTIYPDVVIDVQPGPAPGSLNLVIVAPGEVLLFPMGVAYAATLGKKLTAPRIVAVPQN
jgi:hypothetical protein